MPQPFNHAVITNAGARLLTRAQAGEIRIQFTRIAVGNGTYTAEEKDVANIQKQTDLKSLKNSYALSDIEIHSDHSVKVTVLITNQDPVTKQVLVEEGYYINEIGLYAREVDDDNSKNEVLYSIAVTAAESGDFMPPYNGYNPAQIIQDYYATVGNASEVTIQTNNPAVALAEDLKELRKQFLELNTYLNKIYQQATGYTDQKIADLINGAPETLDTLGEIAKAMKENGDVVEALNEAIGSKASEAEFDSHKKVTEELLGNTDISEIGDGTITGAINELNTGLEWKLLGTVTGTAVLALPESFSELYIDIKYKVGSASAAGSYYYFHLLSIALADSSVYYENTESADNSGRCSILVSRTAYRLGTCFKDTSDCASGAVSRVFYR